MDLFVEDRAHEEFVRALLERLAREYTKAVEIRIRSARGGHARALSEFALYQKSAVKGVGDLTVPDLLVIVIDANCRRFHAARSSIEKYLDPAFHARSVIACPDPHIERWYLADTVSFAHVVGITPKIGRKKCERDLYKAILSQSVVDAGHAPTLGGIEFARELVEAMDLYRAGKSDKSLKAFLDELKVCLEKM